MRTRRLENQKSHHGLSTGVSCRKHQNHRSGFTLRHFYVFMLLCFYGKKHEQHAAHAETEVVPLSCSPPLGCLQEHLLTTRALRTAKNHSGCGLTVAWLQSAVGDHLGADG